MSTHPGTPPSPSRMFPGHNLPAKPITSPTELHSIPTPAPSSNGSMSSITIDLPLEAFPDDCLKRKRDLDDQGDQEKKKVHVEDRSLQLKDLHLDVGDIHLFCKTEHPARLPPLSQDLFERYNLTEIAKTVARTKDDGSKGVKLRKTYKNHIKDHGLIGSFDAVKREINGPETLFAMMCKPDEQWNGEYVLGKEIEKGIETFLPGGGKAFAMARGPIPPKLWSSAVLGEVAAPPVQAETPKPVQNGVRPSYPQQMARPVKGTSKGEIRRPARNVKKRTYGDSSYEGYGEGYVDDETQDTGYSTGGDGDDRGNKKRLKKNPGHGYQGPPMRQASYGPGMVGA